VPVSLQRSAIAVAVEFDFARGADSCSEEPQSWMLLAIVSPRRSTKRSSPEIGCF
jgi:hypothetical protein